jgi:hypothetical protein
MERNPEKEEAILSKKFFGEFVCWRISGAAKVATQLIEYVMSMIKRL